MKNILTTRTENIYINLQYLYWHVTCAWHRQTHSSELGLLIRLANSRYTSQSWSQGRAGEIRAFLNGTSTPLTRSWSSLHCSLVSGPWDFTMFRRQAWSHSSRTSCCAAGDVNRFLKQKPQGEPVGDLWVCMGQAAPPRSFGIAGFRRTWARGAGPISFGRGVIPITQT